MKDSSLKVCGSGFVCVLWRAGGSARRLRVLRNGATHLGKKREKAGGGQNRPGNGTIFPAARLFPIPRPAARTIPFGQAAMTKRNGINRKHRAGGKRRGLRAKRNLRLARACKGENNPFRWFRIAQKFVPSV